LRKKNIEGKVLPIAIPTHAALKIHFSYLDVPATRKEQIKFFKVHKKEEVVLNSLRYRLGTKMVALMVYNNPELFGLVYSNLPITEAEAVKKFDKFIASINYANEQQLLVFLLNDKSAYKQDLQRFYYSIKLMQYWLRVSEEEFNEFFRNLPIVDKGMEKTIRQLFDSQPSMSAQIKENEIKIENLQNSKNIEVEDGEIVESPQTIIGGGEDE